MVGPVNEPPEKVELPEKERRDPVLTEIKPPLLTNVLVRDKPLCALTVILDVLATRRETGQDNVTPVAVPDVDTIRAPETARHGRVDMEVAVTPEFEERVS